MDKDKKIREMLEGKKGAHEDPSLKDIEKLVNATQGMKVPEGKSTDDAWNDFLDKIEEKPEGKSRKLNPWIISMSAAACISIFLVAYTFFFKHTSITVPVGEQQTYVLPDGSEVILNSQSLLTFNKRSFSEEREVELTGEAYFNVEKGDGFKVITPKGEITVLGTSFNVFARNHLTVSCAEGKVEVRLDDNKVILSKGMATYTSDETLYPPEKIDIDKIGAWKKGEFYFNEAHLSEVLDEIERQFNVNIYYDVAEDTRIYTGYFNNKDLDEALSLVLTPMQLTYRKEGKEIFVEE